MKGLTGAIGQITEVLINANVAVPIVFGAVAGIVAIVKGVTGEGPSASEIADLVAAQLKANDENGKAEIARLKAILGQ